MGAYLDLLALPLYLINIGANLLCAVKGVQPCLSSTTFPVTTLRNWLIIDSILPIITSLAIIINFNHIKKADTKSIRKYYQRSFPLYLLRNIWLFIGMYGFFTIPESNMSQNLKYYLRTSIYYNFSYLTLRNFIAFIKYDSPFTQQWKQ